MSDLRGKECSFKIGIGINSGSGLKFLKKSGSGGIGIEKNSKVPTPGSDYEHSESPQLASISKMS